MEWGAIIYSVLGIALFLLKEWAKKAPNREQEKNEDEKEQFRHDVVNHNQPAVQSWLKRMLSSERGGSVARGKDRAS